MENNELQLITTEELEKRLQNELSIFDQVLEYIAELKSEALALSVKDEDDEDGFEVVKEYRQNTIEVLIKQVEEKRVDTKSFYRKAGETIDSKAREIREKLGVLKDHLKLEEKKVLDKRARIKAEEEAKKKKRTDERIAKLQAVNATINLAFVEKVPDHAFDEFLAKETERFKKEEEERIIREEEAEKNRQKNLKLNSRMARLKEIQSYMDFELVQTLPDDEFDKAYDKLKTVYDEKQAAQVVVENTVEPRKETPVHVGLDPAVEPAKKTSIPLSQFEMIQAKFDTLSAAQFEIARVYKLFGIKL